MLIKISSIDFRKRSIVAPWLPHPTTLGGSENCLKKLLRGDLEQFQKLEELDFKEVNFRGQLNLLKWVKNIHAQW